MVAAMRKIMHAPKPYVRLALLMDTSGKLAENLGSSANKVSSTQSMPLGLWKIEQSYEWLKVADWPCHTASFSQCSNILQLFFFFFLSYLIKYYWNLLKSFLLKRKALLIHMRTVQITRDFPLTIYGCNIKWSYI